MHLSRFRPRFTVRRLMVAVAIVGISLGLEGIRRRKAEYSKRWEYHRGNNVQGRMDLTDGLFRMHRGGPIPFRELARESQIQYHGKMARKYERAARYPWLPVAPDPPP